ncbi:MAG: hypothetical protein Q9186_004187 [Xanthomendoza sp. 1 TL-2023]
MPKKKLTGLPEQFRIISDADSVLQATYDNLPRRTRARTQAIKQNAVEAGIIVPENKSRAGKPVYTTRMSYSDDEDSDTGPDDIFEADRAPLDPRPPSLIKDSESIKAWERWDTKQREFNKILNERKYMDSGRRRAYPKSMKDLKARADPDDKDAQPTFELEMRHWQNLELLIRYLHEWGKGREQGFVKIKVPDEAMVPSANSTYTGDGLTKNHRIRLDKIPRNPGVKVDGIYRVKVSVNPHEDSVQTWRAIFADYDREVADNTTTGEPAELDEDLQRLIAIDRQRCEEVEQWRAEEIYLAKIDRQRAKEARMKAKLRSDDQQSLTADATLSKDAAAWREVIQSEDQDQVHSDDASVSYVHTASPQSSTNSATPARRYPRSANRIANSIPSIAATKPKAKTKAKPKLAITFTEKDMLSLPGRHASMTYSPNNPATPSLRHSLSLPTPYQYHLHTSNIHLAGNAGITIPLSTPPPMGEYRVYILLRGGPITWTIVAPGSYVTLMERLHAGGRARMPPEGGGDGLVEKSVYIKAERLKGWGVGVRVVVMRVGEGVVVGWGCVVQGFWWECGVLEEGRVGGRGGGWRGDRLLEEGRVGA